MGCLPRVILGWILPCLSVVRMCGEVIVMFFMRGTAIVVFPKETFVVVVATSLTFFGVTFNVVQFVVCVKFPDNNPH